MNDPGMIGDSGFDKRLAETARRLDEKIAAITALEEEKIAHLKSIVEGNDKRYDQRFQAQEAASTYMRQVTNEFRGQLADQQSTFITRTESLARAQANADKIDALATRLDRTEGRSGGFNAGWGYLVGAVGLVAALIAIFFALSK